MPRTGRPPAITKDDILAVLRDRDRQRHPVMTAPEIAEHVDASRQTVVNRLKEMKGAGEINTTELVGTPVWWPPDEDMTPTKAASIEATDDTDDEGEQETPEGADEPEVRSDGGRTRLERWTAWLTAEGAVITGAGLLAGSVANERWLMILASIVAVFVVIAFGLDLMGKARSVGEWFADRLRWINNKIGNMGTFLWRVVQEGSLAPTDPDTPVERVARFDIVAGGIFVFVALVAVPLGAAVYFLGAEWVFGVLTPKGALGILALLNVLFVLGFVLLYLSAFAAFAIGGVRDRNDHPEPVADVD